MPTCATPSASAGPVAISSKGRSVRASSASCSARAASACSHAWNQDHPWTGSRRTCRRGSRRCRSRADGPPVRRARTPQDHRRGARQRCDHPTRPDPGSRHSATPWPRDGMPSNPVSLSRPNQRRWPGRTGSRLPHGSRPGFQRRSASARGTLRRHRRRPRSRRDLRPARLPPAPPGSRPPPSTVHGRHRRAAAPPTLASLDARRNRDQWAPDRPGEWLCNSRAAGPYAVSWSSLRVDGRLADAVDANWCRALGPRGIEPTRR